MNEDCDGGLAANEKRHIAELVKAACVQAALSGYENAAISGLCSEGALESAVDAIRMLDLDALLRGLGDA